MTDDAELVRRYGPRMTALAKSRLPKALARRIDAEDVVQSAWRSFFLAARSGRVEAPPDGDLWPLLALLTLRKGRRQAERGFAGRRSPRREAGGDSVLADRPAATTAPENAVLLADEVAARLWR